LFKTFSTGVILGVVLAATAANYVPLFDVEREASIITVQPNGGNAELFQIQLPGDRIVAGGRATAPPVPEDLQWPDAATLAGAGLELFKVRNAANRVIGIASRIELSPQATEWALYLPARGAMYVPMAASPEGGRAGTLRAGTREFARRGGRLTEHFLAAGTDDAPDGRIELRAYLVATDAGAVASGGAAP